MKENHFAWRDIVPLIFAGLAIFSLAILIYVWVFVLDVGAIYDQQWSSATLYILPPATIILSWITVGSGILVTWHRNSELITRWFMVYSVVYSIAASTIMLIFFWSRNFVT
jgi:prepilin signal peptidase PulO-like enzyme (type II secretory pathway)